MKTNGGFPNCGGSIDGAHIPIITPTESHDHYLNRKGCYSLIFQDVCGHKYAFRDMIIRWQGRVHDAGALANSGIFQRGESDLSQLAEKKVMLLDQETFLLVVFLADAGYSMKPCPLKP
jgi:hypothetical protein